MRHVDIRERENQILELVVKSYIRESRPISSSYLCDRFNLSCSTATVRNIMESLEKKGLLSHIHTSSGRVPTKEGFKHYIENIRDGLLKRGEPSLDVDINMAQDIEEVFDKALDILATLTRYISLIAISGWEERFLLRGVRYIFDQPEFEDINKLKALFYALEVKIDAIQELLFGYVDEQFKVLVGDEIGCEEISECSLVISGFHQKKISASLALLGPMRMDYVRAIPTLYAVRKKLEEFIIRRDF
ncbi:MAG: HTH domain-containing protein [Candidatus Omnitrophica bacterium]|nr:HTH domain-containing protein [Candidatus Omnitrophota bacterium]